MIHPLVFCLSYGITMAAMAFPFGFPNKPPPSIIPSPITAKMLRSSMRFARVSWVVDAFCTRFVDRRGIGMGYEWFMNGIFMGYNRGIFIWSWYDIWLIWYLALVLYRYTTLWKIMEWTSVGIMTFPTEWKKQMCSKPPTKYEWDMNRWSCGDFNDNCILLLPLLPCCCILLRRYVLQTYRVRWWNCGDVTGETTVTHPQMEERKETLFNGWDVERTATLPGTKNCLAPFKKMMISVCPKNPRWWVVTQR